MIISFRTSIVCIVSLTTSVKLLYALKMPLHVARLPLSLVASANIYYKKNDLLYHTSVGLTSRESERFQENMSITIEKEKMDGYQQIKFGPNASSPGFLRKKFPNFPWYRLPNWLTYCRCAAIPLLLGFFYLSKQSMAPFGIFTLASATDYIDGYLARKWDLTSEFGAFLDPVADKLLVSTVLILLAGRYGASVAIPASIILAREIAVSALREWMAGKGLRHVVEVGYQGKLKTALTMVSLAILLLVPYGGTGLWSKLRWVSFFLLYLSTIITVTSGSLYFQAASF